jgi:hypothetical protein
MSNLNTKYYFFIPVLFAFALMVSCKKDEPCVTMCSDCDAFIFGHFYGKCVGEGCVETFKLENGKLYEDDTDQYAPESYDGHWNELPASKYELVKDLEG